MKHLLHKIFFWDAPAQGAFFGLTLLPVAVWFAFSVFCGILVVNYALLAKPSVIAFLMIVAYAILGYVLILELRMQILLRWKPTFRWKRIWIPLALFALSLLYGEVVCFQGNMHWLLVMCGALVLGCLLWDFRFFAVSWKNLAGALAWMGALLVFWTTFAFAYEPFRSGSLCKLSATMWIMGIIPFYEEIYRGFRLSTAAGSFCFLLFGNLLLLAGYLLFASLLADYAKISLRKLFIRKIRCVWGIAAGSYVVFLALALWETASYHRAIKELEAHFCHPLTSAELERQFYEGCSANPAFWEQIEATLKEYHDSQDELEDELFYHTDTTDAVLPESIHASIKKHFLANPGRLKLEQMLTGPIPPPKRNHADDQLLNAMSSPDLSNVRELAQQELLRIIYALEDGEFNVVSASLERMDAYREYCWKDHICYSFLMGIAVESYRLKAMEKILASGLPPDEWLTAQAARLVEVERQTDLLEEHYLFGESVIDLNIFHWLAHYAGNDTCPCLAGLHFCSLRFYFPQGWWLAANELKGMAKTLRVRHFSELPTSRTGYYGVDLLLPALSKGTVKKQSLIASSRVIRGLIQAELHKRRTGEYPDSIDDLPLDPFSGQPLKYRKDTCEVVQKICQEEVAKEIYQEKGKEKKNGAYCLYASPSLFVSQKRTLQAVQIWSVGPDGIDDGGIAHKSEYGSSEKKKDDIRFIIPIL